MGRAQSLVAVMVIGWSAATLLLYLGLKWSFAFLDTNPNATKGAIAGTVGLVLVPGTPALAAWLAARYCWPATAWVFGVLAAALALVIGYWLIGNLNA